MEKPRTDCCLGESIVSSAPKKSFFYKVLQDATALCVLHSTRNINISMIIPLKSAQSLKTL